MNDEGTFHQPHLQGHLTQTVTFDLAILCINPKYY